MSFTAPAFDTAPAAVEPIAPHPAADPAPPGAASNQAIFQDANDTTTFVNLAGGHETMRTTVRTRIYVAADGGPPIMVRDTTNVVTTVTREVLRGGVVGDFDFDTDSESDAAMAISSSDSLPEHPLRALALAYRAGHPSEVPASRTTTTTFAAVAGPSTGRSTAATGSSSRARAGIAGPSRNGRNNRSAAATRVRRRTFIGPLTEPIYVPSSGEDNNDNEDVGKGKGKACSRDDDAAL
ncbi:hypothetical protein HYPSUDRAFT_203022 [Hypholoma sublateritium FD-334 SS-4]|uniref:Uncharacterized protein n=1 Tax=Hypholoma sublateritium (strain FD-334 SS-4) TaxID=945553 RepID=A0A0D2MD65_HYPSF|nr:hypothetical protein HYPSUDRAFT_203022 [Hypholoma sublateritium FD-334 SS-4]